MATKNRFIIALILAVFLAFNLRGQEAGPVIDKITEFIKNGDAKNLAGYFNSTIDLEVEDTDGSFSKTQAEIILRDFFNKNKVKSFTVNHKGSSNEGSHYMIGSYKTNSAEFRAYILLKKNNQQLLIYQIQFEEE
jgi:hypothetical protein